MRAPDGRSVNPIPTSQTKMTVVLVKTIERRIDWLIDWLLRQKIPHKEYRSWSINQSINRSINRTHREFNLMFFWAAHVDSGSMVLPTQLIHYNTSFAWWPRPCESFQVVWCGQWWKYKPKSSPFRLLRVWYMHFNWIILHKINSPLQFKRANKRRGPIYLICRNQMMGRDFYCRCNRHSSVWWGRFSVVHTMDAMQELCFIDVATQKEIFRGGGGISLHVKDCGNRLALALLHRATAFLVDFIVYTTGLIYSKYVTALMWYGWGGGHSWLLRSPIDCRSSQLVVTTPPAGCFAVEQNAIWR